MAVNDDVRNALESYGGFSINTRVYNYLGSLGYTGTISDRLAKYSYEDKKGWQALIARYAGTGWTPAALFAQGQQGVWYEPKPEYLYQDAAGTVPVTADGDPVGYMQDLSGNGNHATQSTSAARPIYRTDGMLHWLAFDGVDDYLRYVFPSAVQYPLSIVQACDEYGATESAASVIISDPAGSAGNSQAYFSLGSRSDGLGPAIGVYSSGAYSDRTLGLAGGRYAFSTIFRTGEQVLTDSGGASDASLNKPQPTGATALGINALIRTSITHYPGLFFGAVVVLGDIGASEATALSYFSKKLG